MSPVRTVVIGHSFVARAKTYMAENGLSNLRLPAEYHDVSLCGKGGAKIADIPELYSRGPVNPDLLIVDVGTNDLAGTCSPSHLASALVGEIRGIRACRVIIFFPLFRSYRGRHRGTPDFNERVKSFNARLKRIIHGIDSDLHLWYHKGLSAQASAFISDGVLLNPEGLKKYVRSLRRAVMKFTSDMVSRA